MAPINKDRDLPNGLDGNSETDNPQESPEAEAEDFTPTPKSLRFKYLSILWFLPSFGAVWILVFEAGSVLSKPSFTSKLRAVSVEQWVALVLLLLHSVFIGLARHYRRKEKSFEVSG